MRARLLALTILAATATVPGPASASPPDDAGYTGRCSLVAASNTTQVLDPPGAWRGVLGGVAAGYAPTAGHNPVTTYLSCDVRVNGVVVASADIVQSGVVTEAAEVVRFNADRTDHVEVCDDVATWDAHGQRKSWYVCHFVQYFKAPPQVVLDTVCPLAWAVCPVVESNQTHWLVSGPL